MIRFRCGNCQTLCSYPTAGEKVSCPKCGQKLLVPSLPPPPAQNKTVLGVLEPSTSIVQPSLPTAQLPFAEPIIDTFLVHGESKSSQPPMAADQKHSRERPINRDSSREEPSGIAVLFAVGGLGLIAFFWLVYDTTVQEFPGIDWSPRIHNLGLMQNRLIGTIVGAVLFGAGIVMWVFRRKRD